MPPFNNDAGNDFLSGGQRMGELMRSQDWTKTTLGPPELWPQSLRTSVSICLNCRFAILIWWGPDLVMLYNDDYSPMLGNKHPLALGAIGREVWSDVWPVVGPMLESVVRTGEATESHDLQLIMDRHGYQEEAYFTFSYSPIRDESGGVAGVFTPVVETTQRVIGERRLRVLRDLAAHTSNPGSAEEACTAAAKVLEHCGYDVPFAVIYLVEGDRATLAAVANAEPNSAIAPNVLNLAGEPCVNPICATMAEVVRTKNAALVNNLSLDLSPHHGSFHADGWQASPGSAYVLPVFIGNEGKVYGVLLVGINPRREFDDEYRSFYSLVAAQIASAMASGMAHEQERKRATARTESLAQMFNTAPAFIAVMRGPEHVFELVNQKYLQLVGHRDLIGKPARRAVPDAEGQGFFDLLDQVYRTGVAFHGEALPIQLQRQPDGPPETRYITFGYQPMTEPGGEVAGIFLLGVDVTDQVMAQDALRRSEKLAAAGRLAATIAHEINNPLEATTNLLYLAKEDCSSSAKEYLDLAEHELARVAHITKQTLAFYKESTAPSTFDLAKAVQAILVFYRKHAENQGVEIVTELAPDCIMFGVEGEIKQVVSNLLGNAVDAFNGRRGTIKLRAHPLPDRVRFIVADSGQGIEPQHMEQIWQPFFTTKELVGTGLGLWVTKGILAKHKATIRVRSKRGGDHSGTTFVLDFPHAESMAGGF